MEVSCNVEVSINIDGEILRSKNIAYEIIPKGINIVIPDYMYHN